MQVTVKMLRRNPASPHVTTDPNAVVGQAYTEYEEVWEKQDDTPVRISDTPTGRRLVLDARLPVDSKDPRMTSPTPYEVDFNPSTFEAFLMREVFPCNALEGPTMQCCGQDAAFWVGTDGRDDYSYACGDHVEDLKRDGDKVYRLSDSTEIV